MRPEKQRCTMVQPPKVEKDHHEEPLKGTFVSVMLLGGFLLLTWVLVFVLFLARS